MIARCALSTEDVVKATKGILLNGDMGIVFRGVTTDSRRAEEGVLFFALKGKRYDGHDFVKAVIAKGAKGAVVERMPENLSWNDLPRDFSVILVKDTLFALGELAKAYRASSSFLVCAITGSCGKTTTKEMTYQILSRFYRCGKNEANFNNLIGVPMSILQQEENLDWVVLEMATNAPGEIARLTEIAAPNLGAITCVYPSHLEGLGSIEGVLQEKTSLFLRMKEDGVIVYIFDQPELVERVKVFPQRKISFGFKRGAKLQAESIEGRNGATLIKLSYEDRNAEVVAKVEAKTQVLNLLGSMAIALGTGLDFEQVISAVESIESFFRRLKVIRGKDLIILDDTYNANPGSMAAALEYLRDFEAPSLKKVAILGDMKELGSYAAEAHRRVAELAKAICDQAIFVGEHALDYADGFGTMGSITFPDTESLVEAITSGELKLSSSVVLIKGSRAMQLERVISALKGEGP